MEVTGVLTHVLKPINGTSARGEWKKQTFVIATEGEYPKDIAFDIFNDKCNIEGFAEGESLTVAFNLESREYQGKWFTNVNAWNIKPNGGQTTPPSQPTASSSGNMIDEMSEDKSDMPF